MPISKKYKRKTTHRHKCGVICIILAVLFIVLLFFSIHVRPIIKTMSSIKSENFVTALISTQISQQMLKSGYQYDDLVHISYNEQGVVTSLQSDSMRINELSNTLTAEINQTLMQMENTKIQIPLGDLLQTPYFSGMGPNIPITLIPKGTVRTQIISNFEEAGVNQTKHRIIAKFDLQITSIIPTCSTTTSISCDYPLAETIIVGTVPNFYNKILTNQTSSG